MEYMSLLGIEKHSEKNMKKQMKKERLRDFPKEIRIHAIRRGAIFLGRY